MKELTINSIHYTESELKLFANEQLKKHSETWQQALYNFILFWIDNNKDSIEVRTSGSTGKPKNINITKEQMTNSARMTIAYFGLQPNDTALLCLPVDYIAGKMMLVRAFIGQLNLLITPPSSSPLNTAGPISEKIDFCAMTPMQTYQTLNDEYTASIFKQFGQVIIGGGSISPALLAKLETFPNRIYETYGMTETVSHIAIKQICPKREMTFNALPGIKIEQDKNSCLVIKAPGLTNDELHTSDVVDMQNSSQFIWKGRLDNVINSGGIKLSPEKMEQQIAPLIEDRFIIGSIPDDIYGQKIVLILEGQSLPKHKEYKLLENLKKQIDSPVYPKSIRYISAFPETGFGKINRKEILKLTEL